MATLELEQKVRDQTGLAQIAGLDEAGRGALAGPVVAAAVILPLDDAERLARLSAVNDSKQLSPRQRDRFYELIIANALAYGVGSASAAVIDEIGIIAANVRAMTAALEQMPLPADYLLIDGRMRLKNVPLPQQSIIWGDSLSLSIAAASILAKVTRDRHMVALADQYPQYGFARHKGYCTRRHEAALVEHGPCAVHRHSFAPIRPSLL